MTTRSRTLALIVTSLAVLTACGGGQEASATADAGTSVQAAEAEAAAPTTTRLAVATTIGVDTPTTADAAAAPAAAVSPGGPVITAAMVRTVGAPPRPNNGVVKVHPGIHTREHALRDSVGARSASTPHIGD